MEISGTRLYSRDDKITFYVQADPFRQGIGIFDERREPGRISEVW